VEAAARVLRSRSLFRHYGIDPQYDADRFEAEFRAFTGTRHALAVSSGTGALHVAWPLLAWAPDKRSSFPPSSGCGLRAVVNLGAIPVLADIDDTFCLDPADVERRVTGHTRGVVMIHMSGAPGDVHGVLEVARRHGLFLLEDCAQCAGGTVAGRSVGTFGDAAVFSFQMNKNMTSGEGGCVITNDDRLFGRMFASHDLGYMRDDNGRLVTDDPDFLLWGRGYRMDEIRAAVLRVQLAKLPRIVGAMRHSKQRIRAALQGMPEVKLRRLVDSAGDTSCFLLTIFRDGSTAATARDALRAEGSLRTPREWLTSCSRTLDCTLTTRRQSGAARQVDRAGFREPSVEPELGGIYERGACPVADDLFERTLMLPIPSCLTELDEDDINCAYGEGHKRFCRTPGNIVTVSVHPRQRRRVLKLRHLVFYGIVLIQPTAPMPLFGIASQVSKGHAVLAVLIALVAMLFTAIAYGRMARVYPSAGSAYTYVGGEIHPLAGEATGWAMMLDYVLNPILCTIWCSKAAGNLLPGVPYGVWVVLFALLFTSLNLRGIETRRVPV